MYKKTVGMESGDHSVSGDSDERSVGEDSPALLQGMSDHGGATDSAQAVDGDKVAAAVDGEGVAAAVEASEVVERAGADGDGTDVSGPPAITVAAAAMEGHSAALGDDGAGRTFVVSPDVAHDSGTPNGADDSIQSFLGFEDQNNPLLRLLREHDSFAAAAAFAQEPRGLILLPQSVALEDIDVGDSFVDTHVVKVEEDSLAMFRTRNGARGIFSGPASEVLNAQSSEFGRTTVLLTSLPEWGGMAGAGTDGERGDGVEGADDVGLPRQDAVPPAAEARDAPAGESWRGRSASSGSEAPVIWALRRGSVQLRGVQTCIVLMSDPIQVPGTPWPRRVMPPALPPRNESKTPDRNSPVPADVADPTAGNAPSPPPRPASPAKRDKKKPAPLPLNAATATSSAGSAGGPASPATGTLPIQYAAGLNFNAFLEKMRRPEAFELVKMVKRFITEFLETQGRGRSGSASRRRPPLPPPPMPQTAEAREAEVEKMAEGVRAFLERAADAMYRHPLWRTAADDELDNALEGMEKYLMHKISSVAFCPHVSDDAAVDAALHRRISELALFVEPRHLDIGGGGSPGGDDEAAGAVAWELSVKELLKINAYKAPRDKMICILNCCKVLFNLLQQQQEQQQRRRRGSGGGGGPAGADEFLPRLIYAVLRANPPQLCSNVRFIQRFRSPDRLQSEAGYYLTNLFCAIAFIEKIDADALTMEPGEFERCLAAARRQLGPPPAAAVAAAAQGLSLSPFAAAAAPRARSASGGSGGGGRRRGSSSSSGGGWRRNGAAGNGGEGGEAEAEAEAKAAAAKLEDAGQSALALFNIEGGAPVQRFLDTKSAQDLRVGELQRLLEDYQRIAAMNDRLIKTLALNMSV